jgi:hypothetical protein
LQQALATGSSALDREAVITKSGGDFLGSLRVILDHQHAGHV